MASFPVGLDVYPINLDENNFYSVKNRKVRGDFIFLKKK